MQPRYCSACGHALEAFHEHGHERRRCPSCGRVHYENPKAAVGAVIVRDGRILLSKRARPPKAGEWDLPGGFLEVREHPEDAMRREIKEETGLDAVVRALVHVGVGTYSDAGTLNLVYLVDVEGEPTPSDDSLEMTWFPLDDLPALAWPHEAEAIRAYRAGRGVGDGPGAP